MIHAAAAILILVAVQDLDDVKDRLAGDSPDERKKGYAALESLSPRDRASALRFLADLGEDLRREYDGDVKSLTGLLDFAKARKSLEAWEKARDRALAIVFDHEKYPAPTGGEAVSGPCKGYTKVNAAIRSLRSRFEPLEERIDGVLEGRPSRKWKALRAKSDRIDEIAEVLAKYGKKAEPLERWTDPFWEAVAAFDSGDIAAGAKIHGTELPAEQKKFLFLFYCRAFLKAEAAAESVMDRDSREAVRRINVLRMKLGILPLEGDDRLARAMKLHLDDMAENRYFAHGEKNEATRTPQKRCAKQGYKGFATENLSTSPPVKSVEIWMWDGGHFRTMVGPAFVQIGFAGGPRPAPAESKVWCGFDVGTGDRPRLPRIEVPWKLPGR